MMTAPEVAKSPASSKWMQRIHQKREEIERDTRQLTEAKARRAHALYISGKSSDGLSTTSSDVSSGPAVIDGRLELSGLGLLTCALPRQFDTGQLRTIQSLVLRGNRIRGIDAHLLAPLTALLFLDLSDNDLERLGPVGTTRFDECWPSRLLVLLASKNRIIRLSTGSGGLMTLEKLDVSRNKIRFIGPDLDKLPRLRHLDARHNYLNDINLAALKHLATLRHLECLLLTGNPIVRDPRHQLKLFAQAPRLRDALNAPHVTVSLDRYSRTRPRMLQGPPDIEQNDTYNPSRQNSSSASATVSRRQQAQHRAFAWPAVGAQMRAAAYAPF